MSTKEKKLLFTVSAADCDWSYTRGRGAGGQKKNKTSSAVHCSHRPSGAHGYAEDSRSQYDNKRLAFVRMVETKEFKRWHAMEVSRRTGELQRIEENVQQEMRRVKVEIRQDDKWIEVSLNDPLDKDNDNDTTSSME